MENKYYNKLNSILKKDYDKIANECLRIYEENYEAYDVVIYLNDYIYNLSDTVNHDYFLAVSELENYYMSIYQIETILNELAED